MITRRRVASVVGAAVVLLANVLLTPLPASASPADGSGIDVYKPQFHGFDKKVGAYKFSVYYRWRAVCGTGYYCYSDDAWPFYSGSQKVSDPDIISMAFNKPVSVKKVLFKTYRPCSATADQTSSRLVGPDTSWNGASSELQDTSYAVTGTCEKTRRYYSKYDASNMASGTYTVWVQPIGCRKNIRVRAFFTHSWSSTTISVSPQAPWGISVSASSSKHYWSVSNRSDGVFDDDLLVAARKCPR